MTLPRVAPEPPSSTPQSTARPRDRRTAQPKPPHQRGLTAQRAGRAPRRAAYQKLSTGTVKSSINNFVALVMQQAICMLPSLPDRSRTKSSSGSRRAGLLLNNRCQLHLRLHEPDIAAHSSCRYLDSPLMRSAGPTCVCVTDNNQPGRRRTLPTPGTGAMRNHHDPNSWSSASSSSTIAPNSIRCCKTWQCNSHSATHGSWLTGNCWRPDCVFCLGAWRTSSASPTTTGAIFMARRNRRDNLRSSGDEQVSGDAAHVYGWLPQVFPFLPATHVAAEASLISLVEHWPSQQGDTKTYEYCHLITRISDLGTISCRTVC